MAVLSKLVLDNLRQRLIELSRNPSSRRALLFLVATVLVVRAAVLPPCSRRRAAEVTKDHKKTVTRPGHEEHAADIQFFPLNQPQSPDGKSKPKNLTVSFFRQLRSLLRIVIPSLRTNEALLLITHSLFLVFRTVLSVAVARLDGRIVRDLVGANSRGFVKGMGLWFALAVPSVYTNAMVSKLTVLPGFY